jgi:hypothetical protein
MMVMHKRCSPQKTASWYRLLKALRARIKHICYRRICESTEQVPEPKYRDVCEEDISHSAKNQILEVIRQFFYSYVTGIASYRT